MPRVTDFETANRLLGGYSRPAGVTGGYKLDNMIAFLARIGNPQDSYKSIHVAGTSGKTSTCYYLTAFLVQAGYIVGQTISPHVDEVNERAQINGVSLPEAEYCGELDEFLQIVDNSGISLSYFEVVVAFAFWLFAKHKVDYAVVEVGLGGLLDGTNVITRHDKICVITDIGYDHVEVLGKTLPQIAAQKAGIILRGNHIFTHAQPDEVMEVIAATATQKVAQLNTIEPRSKDQEPAALPPFQRRNLQLAQAVAEYVVRTSSRPQIDYEVFQLVAQTYIPARMEVVHFSGKDIVMDGSHNSQKIAALATGIKEKFPNKSAIILLSLGNNKQLDMINIVMQLKELSSSIVITKFSYQQDEVRHAIEPSEIAAVCKEAGFNEIQTINDPAEAFNYACSSNHELVLVTGSYFLLNHIRPLLPHR